MNNKKKRKIFLLLILLLGITVGFALLSRQLNIFGTSNITAASFNIHWDNIANEKGVEASTPAYIKDAKKTIVEYEVDLAEPGDFYEFTVDAVNEGTMDGEITKIESTVNGNDISTLPNYIVYSVTYDDGSEIQLGDILAKKSGTTPTSKTYKIKVKYDENLITKEALDNMPEEGLTFVFDFNVTYSQADPMEKDTIWILPVGKTADDLDTGDEICLRADPTQCFNFIRYDGNDVVMLSKYNLKVGNIYSSGAMKIGEYTSSDPGYGLQSSEARGFVSGEPGYGTVSFSTTNYWYDGSGLKPEYGDSYTANVYDAVNYVGEPGELDENERPTNPNYSIAYYVEGYKTKLTNEYHATIKESRLLTYAEATDPSIGCSDSNNNCPTTGFITNTSFLLGSAYNARTIWNISTNGYFQHSNYRSTYDTGVRPVIEVSKSDL